MAMIPEGALIGFGKDYSQRYGGSQQGASSFGQEQPQPQPQEQEQEDPGFLDTVGDIWESRGQVWDERGDIASSIGDTFSYAGSTIMEDLAKHAQLDKTDPERYSRYSERRDENYLKLKEGRDNMGAASNMVASLATQVPIMAGQMATFVPGVGWAVGGAATAADMALNAAEMEYAATQAGREVDNTRKYGAAGASALTDLAIGKFGSKLPTSAPSRSRFGKAMGHAASGAKEGAAYGATGTVWQNVGSGEEDLLRGIGTGTAMGGLVGGTLKTAAGIPDVIKNENHIYNVDQNLISGYQKDKELSDIARQDIRNASVDDDISSFQDAEDFAMRDTKERMLDRVGYSEELADHFGVRLKADSFKDIHVYDDDGSMIRIGEDLMGINPDDMSLSEQITKDSTPTRANQKSATDEALDTKGYQLDLKSKTREAINKVILNEDTNQNQLRKLRDEELKGFEGTEQGKVIEADFREAERLYTEFRQYLAQASKGHQFSKGDFDKIRSDTTRPLEVALKRIGAYDKMTTVLGDAGDNTNFDLQRTLEGLAMFSQRAKRAFPEYLKDTKIRETRPLTPAMGGGLLPAIGATGGIGGVLATTALGLTRTGYNLRKGFSSIKDQKQDIEIAKKDRQDLIEQLKMRRLFSDKVSSQEAALSARGVEDSPEEEVITSQPLPTSRPGTTFDGRQGAVRDFTFSPDERMDSSLSSGSLSGGMSAAVDGLESQGINTVVSKQDGGGYAEDQLYLSSANKAAASAEAEVSRLEERILRAIDEGVDPRVVEELKLELQGYRETADYARQRANRLRRETNRPQPIQQPTPQIDEPVVVDTPMTAEKMPSSAPMSYRERNIAAQSERDAGKLDDFLVREQRVGSRDKGHGLTKDQIREVVKGMGLDHTNLTEQQRDDLQYELFQRANKEASDGEVLADDTLNKLRERFSLKRELDKEASEQDRRDLEARNNKNIDNIIKNYKKVGITREDLEDVISLTPLDTTKDFSKISRNIQKRINEILDERKVAETTTDAGNSRASAVKYAMAIGMDENTARKLVATHPDFYNKKTNFTESEQAKLRKFLSDKRASDLKDEKSDLSRLKSKLGKSQSRFEEAQAALNKIAKRDRTNFPDVVANHTRWKGAYEEDLARYEALRDKVEVDEAALKEAKEDTDSSIRRLVERQAEADEAQRLSDDAEHVRKIKEALIHQMAGAIKSDINHPLVREFSEEFLDPNNSMKELNQHDMRSIIKQRASFYNHNKLLKDRDIKNFIQKELKNASPMKLVGFAEKMAEKYNDALVNYEKVDLGELKLIEDAIQSASKKGESLDQNSSAARELRVASVVPKVLRAARAIQEAYPYFEASHMPYQLWEMLQDAYQGTHRLTGAEANVGRVGVQTTMSIFGKAKQGNQLNTADSILKAMERDGYNPAIFMQVMEGLGIDPTKPYTRRKYREGDQTDRDVELEAVEDEVMSYDQPTPETEVVEEQVVNETPVEPQQIQTDLDEIEMGDVESAMEAIISFRNENGRKPDVNSTNKQERNLAEYLKEILDQDRYRAYAEQFDDSDILFVSSLPISEKFKQKMTKDVIKQIGEKEGKAASPEDISKAIEFVKANGYPNVRSETPEEKKSAKALMLLKTDPSYSLLIDEMDARELIDDIPMSIIDDVVAESTFNELVKWSAKTGKKPKLKSSTEMERELAKFHKYLQDNNVEGMSPVDYQTKVRELRNKK